MEDHSIFYACIRDESAEIINLPESFYSDNKLIFDKFIKYHEQLVKSLNSQIQEFNTPIYLFGAHIFSQYLLQFGLKSESIKFILDNDPNKHNKRLYGTDLLVKTPKILKDINKPIVLLKAGAYNKEIKDDILSNVNASTIFI